MASALCYAKQTKLIMLCMCVCGHCVYTVQQAICALTMQSKPKADKMQISFIAIESCQEKIANIFFITHLEQTGWQTIFINYFSFTNSLSVNFSKWSLKDVRRAEAARSDCPKANMYN